MSFFLRPLGQRLFMQHFVLSKISDFETSTILNHFKEYFIAWMLTWARWCKNINNRIKGPRQIISYLAGHVLPNRKLSGGTCPAKYEIILWDMSRQIGNYLAGHVLPNRKLFGGTVLPNSFPQFFFTNP